MDDDPVLAPFFLIHLEYKERLDSRVKSLTDDELSNVIDLFEYDNYKNIPREFWLVGALVRARCRRELEKRRLAAERVTIPA